MTLVVIGVILAVWMLGGALLATTIGRVAALRRDDDALDLATVAFLDELWALEPVRPAGSVGVGSE